MTGEIRDIVGRMYENFLMRDLTYVVGGSVVLASIKYTCDGNLICSINYISQNFLRFIIFITISYFIGLLVQEGILLIRIKGCKIVETEPTPPHPYNDYLLCMADIQKKYGGDTIRRIERIIYLKNIGSAIASASLISSLILLFPLFKHHRIGDFIIFFFFALLTIVCVIENRNMLNKQNETLRHFAEDIRKE